MRRGSLTVELVVACAALLSLASMASWAAQARMANRATEARAVALETAQNLCDALRHGRSPELPIGWSVSRAAAAPGVVAVTVTGPDRVRLTTLVRE